jgi:ADP-L-glycero-D-manno-heptose 6-epimerase
MILITGATGFIGSAMIRQFNTSGRSDILIVDTVAPNERPTLMMKSCLYTRFISYADFIKNTDTILNKSIEAVVHMGAISATTEKSWDKLVEHNLELSKKLFKSCAGLSIPFIYASSGAVYGDGALGFDDEIHPKQYLPLNLYGQSKRDFDSWALEQTHTPPNWYGLRFFNVYGPNEYQKGPMTSVIFKAYNQIKESGSLKLFKSHRSDYKDGESMRDFVYVKDITRWILELTFSAKIKSGIYNQGFGQARSWLDLASAVFKNMNVEMKIDWQDIPEDIRNQYQYFTEAKMTKAFAAGFTKPQYDLESGIKDYILNHLQNENPYL